MGRRIILHLALLTSQFKSSSPSAESQWFCHLERVASRPRDERELKGVRIPQAWMQKKFGVDLRPHGIELAVAGCTIIHAAAQPFFEDENRAKIGAVMKSVVEDVACRW